MDEKYGLFFRDIPITDVPFDNTVLEYSDRIKNVYGQQLIYYGKERGYKYITNDQNRFISKEQMLSPWKHLK
jgi:hypothetical protein